MQLPFSALAEETHAGDKPKLWEHLRTGYSKFLLEAEVEGSAFSSEQCSVSTLVGAPPSRLVSKLSNGRRVGRYWRPFVRQRKIMATWSCT